MAEIAAAARVIPVPRHGFADALLYQLARVFYRSDVAHDAGMKTAQRSLADNNRYRANQSDKVLDAARRFRIELADRDLLDLGCHDGALTIRYATAGPRSVIGVDIDEQAVRRAQHERAHARVSYRVASTTQLPLDDHSVDVVLCYDVFEHVAEPAKILAECRRILRPGGTMLIGTWGWGNKFAPHLWAAMPVPWAHVLFSERFVLAACRRVFHASWYRPTFHDLDADGRRQSDRYCEASIDPQYLNKYFIRDFERVFASSGFEASVTLDPIAGVGALRPMMRIPIVREYLHGYLWAVLRNACA
jgi:2-polyprenyl-3-methyl-5-hydroxy-6-metoxy-1,4-benzoquinol methylase